MLWKKTSSFEEDLFVLYYQKKVLGRGRKTKDISSNFILQADLLKHSSPPVDSTEHSKQNRTISYEFQMWPVGNS